ncbi:hypothetical protein COY33_01975 [candidate division WWE3 bacterium CG_4_10_14_0_2_um_filter_42_7]|uniref:Glycosyltransferase RgtA/B/C/D-like domain-containing protein n=2 Tax=Katanobacteria TaxID=422282 RepID=A0A2H0X9W1_UNCKA|nr:MAG: hypothetical protein COT51_01260 [candidate division WWE3 bacterium CG08_land_8_20_14_0_20_41_15]PIZ43201.1 MAG: hypothetical protein COY33_01975 [candidate division WWE3 bacterium CG_4_10_14_0_2_um_filter_42_7]
MLEKIAKLLIPFLPFLLVTLFLRLPSFFEPYWQYDESITLSVAQGIRRGEVLYKEIADNKPPLLYLTMALFGGTLLGGKIATAIFVILAEIGFFLLAEKLLKDRKKAFIALSIFTILINIPTFEGNLINGEIFFIAPIIWGALLALSASSKKALLATGFLYGVAILFKAPAITDFGALVVFFWVMRKKSWIKDFIWLVTGGFLSFLPFIVHFLLKGAFIDFLNQVFLFNFSYTTAWVPFHTNPRLFLALKLLSLLIFTFVIIRFRKRLSQDGEGTIFLLFWLGFSVNGAMISSRPYAHYLIQIIPPVSIILAFIIDKKWNLARTFSLLTIVFLYISVSTQRFDFYPTVPYYRCFFAGFLTGQSTETFYYDYNPALTKIYKAAEIVENNSSKEDEILVWADLPEIYTLTKRGVFGRYPTLYQIKSWPDGRTSLNTVLKTEKPRLIVVDKSRKLWSEIKTLMSKYQRVGKVDNLIVLSSGDEK